MNDATNVIRRPLDVTKFAIEDSIEKIVKDVHDPARKGTGNISPKAGDDHSGYLSSPAPRPSNPPEPVQADPINPPHYRTHPSGIECIEVTRHLNFNIGNAIKYLWRYMDKGDPVENLKKAQWYIDDEIRRLQGIR